MSLKVLASLSRSMCSTPKVYVLWQKCHNNVTVCTLLVCYTYFCFTELWRAFSTCTLYYFITTHLTSTQTRLTTASAFTCTLMANFCVCRVWYFQLLLMVHKHAIWSSNNVMRSWRWVFSRTINWTTWEIEVLLYWPLLLCHFTSSYCIITPSYSTGHAQ